MKTHIAMENSNCPVCLEETLGQLQQRKGVKRVWSDFASGCIVVEHEDDPEAVVSFVTTTGRGVAVAANGERVMVPLDGHQEPGCQVARSVVRGQPRGRRAVTPSEKAAASGGESAATELSARSPRGRLVSAASPTTSISWRSPRGVRVLPHERPGSGVVLRAVRLVARMYRVHC